MTVDELVQKIDDVQPKRAIKIIGVSGFCGSGKSTLAEKLGRQISGAEVIPIDDFIAGPQRERSEDWRTFDRERLRREVLDVAKPAKPLTYMQYHSGAYAGGLPGIPRTIRPETCLIIEGCGILHPSLLGYFDLSVWIKTVILEVVIARAKQRDRAQGNNDAKLWDKTWELNDVDYYNKYHPDELASIVFDWSN